MVSDLDTRQQTDEQLLAEAAREGSGGPAFCALLQRHRERVWRICYRLMGNEHDAGDAVQEVFVNLFLNRARFAGRSRFTTWLHAMAVKTCLSLRRSRGRRQRREAEFSAHRAVQPAERSAEATTSAALDLSQMLQTLDEEDRAMVILKYAEGYSYEDLSQLFERSVSACKMRVSRALAELRERFPEHTT